MKRKKREEAGRLWRAVAFCSVVDKASAAQTSAKSGSSSTEKHGSRRAKTSSLVKPQQWQVSVKECRVRQLPWSRCARATSYETSQDLCVSCYNGKDAGAQHSDFAQHLLSIPWAKQEIVSGGKALLTFQKFPAALWQSKLAFHWNFLLENVRGFFPCTVLQAPACYVVTLGKRMRGKGVKL